MHYSGYCEEYILKKILLSVSISQGLSCLSLRNIQHWNCHVCLIHSSLECTKQSSIWRTTKKLCYLILHVQKFVSILLTNHVLQYTSNMYLALLYVEHSVTLETKWKQTMVCISWLRRCIDKTTVNFKWLFGVRSKIMQSQYIKKDNLWWKWRR